MNRVISALLSSDEPNAERLKRLDHCLDLIEQMAVNQLTMWAQITRLEVSMSKPEQYRKDDAAEDTVPDNTPDTDADVPDSDSSDPEETATAPDPGTPAVGEPKAADTGGKKDNDKGDDTPSEGGIPAGNP